MAQRNQPPLPAGAQNQHVGIDRIAQHAQCQIVGVKERHPFTQTRLQRQFQPVRGHLKVAETGEIAGNDLVIVHHRAGPVGCHQSDGLGPRRHHKIAADDAIGLARRHADCADILGAVGQAQVDMDRTALLGQPRHLHHAGALAVDMRRLRQNRADGHHARAPDARDDDVMRAVDCGQRWQGQIGNIERLGLGTAQLAALHGDKAWAEPVEAGIILVAAGLVDLPLAAQLGVFRHDRHAVRLDRAVAAALADVRVDPDPPVGVREMPLLAPPSLFRRTGLDIEDRADARDFLQLALDIHQLGAFLESHPGRK